MMYRVKKVIASLLALAVLLAPIEFVYAHDAETAHALEDMVMSQHTHDAADHPMLAADGGQHECGDQGTCSHCVYCSPALSHIAQFALEKPVAASLNAPVPANYSIDLPVHIRPPRYL